VRKKTAIPVLKSDGREKRPPLRCQKTPRNENSYLKQDQKREGKSGVSEGIGSFHLKDGPVRLKSGAATANLEISGLGAASKPNDEAARA